MKDIPVFATQYGVAALALQQIPYTGIANITIHSTQMFEEFLAECVGFCRAAGADKILACGHNELEAYPVYTTVLKMQMPVPETEAQAYLFPATDETIDRWLDIYNNGMANVPNALILSKKMAKEIVNAGTAYFVHMQSRLLGIGIVQDDMVRAVVSCQKGAGECVMNTLVGAVCGDTVKVEVAENNEPAMRLYRRMGFVTAGIVNVWHDVTKKVCDVK